MSKKSIVDTGSPPASVTAHNTQKQAILDGEATVDLKNTDHNVKEADYNPSIGFEPKSKLKTYAAELLHELYHITLEILDISISDFQLALKVPRSGFKFEPVPQSTFKLKTKGTKYNVTYLGGIFDFPSDEHWTITFLIEPADIARTPGILDEQIMQALE
jgi:hypothetical protein